MNEFQHQNVSQIRRRPRLCWNRRTRPPPPPS